MGALVATATATVGGAPPAPRASATAGGSAVVALAGARILDTRSGPDDRTIDGAFEAIGKRAAGSELRLMVTGRGDVPRDATAVFVNLTSVAAESHGYLTAYPCDAARPHASHVNYAPGPHATPNGTLVGIGASGEICIFTTSAVHVLADVTAFVPGGGGPVALTPARLLDTRHGADDTTYDSEFRALGKRAAGTELRLVVAGRGGVPDDARAVFVNLTAVEPDQAGYLTAYPCGAARPHASHVNYSRGAHATPNGALVGVGERGEICIYTLAATHVLADVTAYVPTGAQPEPVRPARLVDTRREAWHSTVDSRDAGIGTLTDGAELRVTVTGRGGVPDDASAVFLNVTAVDPRAAGHLAVWPCGSPRPHISHVNFAAHTHATPNGALVGVGADGQVCVGASRADTDLVLDVTAFVRPPRTPTTTSTTTTPTTTPPPTAPPTTTTTPATTAPTTTVPTTDGTTACEPGGWCAGAAKVIVTPSAAHIAGVLENRLGLGERLQQFHLGGYGLNPLGNLPDPVGGALETVTPPAAGPVYHSERTGTDEHTYLRVLWLESGGTRVAFVTLDAIGAGNVIQEGVRQAIVAESCAADRCIAADHIVFGQTHTHTGADLQGLWGGVPQDWIDNTLYAGAATAIREAITTRRPATLSVGQTTTGEFNNYRRPQLDEINPADTDHHLSLLRVAASDGTPIAQLLQYAAHPVAIDEEPRVPHADYIYAALAATEASGGVGLYFNGPIADASGAGRDCPLGGDPLNDYERTACHGRNIAATALHTTTQQVDPLLAVRNQTVSLPVTNPLFLAAAPAGAFNRYYQFSPAAAGDLPVLGDLLGTVQTEIGQVPSVAETLVTRVSLGGPGGVEIVTIPGEATNTFGEFIRTLAADANPGATVLLLGLTQQSFGYILPEEEFNYFDVTGGAGLFVPYTSYEEFVSLGPLTAPLLRLQGYLPLFDGDASQLPDYLQACTVDPGAEACLLNDIADQLNAFQSGLARQCEAVPDVATELCAVLDPTVGLPDICAALGLPPALCDVFP